jgi:hypothetical protein
LLVIKPFIILTSCLSFSTIILLNIFLDSFKFNDAINGTGFKSEAVGVSGNYQFSIFYNGEKIQTIPVIFEPNTTFNRTF